MQPAKEEKYQHKWFVLLAVGMGVFLATLDGSIVNISLPAMVTSLDTTFTIIQWVVLSNPCPLKRGIDGIL